MPVRPDARVREPSHLSGGGVRTTLIGRLAVIAAVAVAVVAVVLLIRGGDHYEVTAEFENAGQLVTGNQVLFGGSPVGSVTEIEIGDRNQALVTFSVDDDFAPLHEGTVVTVRRPSLSQVAGRQIEITPPPTSEAGPEIPDGGRIDEEQTISVVDVDQFFDMLDEETVEGFKKVIQGFERGYEGVGRQANRGYRYLNPLFSSGREVFQELVGSQPSFERLLVDRAQLSGALAARSSDVSQLIGNANRMMNALGDRRESLTRGIRLFPGFMRSANTTFVNLRAALDDVDPLVDASKPVAKIRRS
jgi:phospholipid/cholesterol/gamma-HCH transport system substrate-binding protein